MTITPLSIAKNLMGVAEVPGPGSNHLIMWMLNLDNDWPTNDDVPWCSGFVNGVALLCGCPRSRSLAARSWLTVGREITTAELTPGFDLVVLSRGNNPTAGHVGFFDGWDDFRPRNVILVGGNQGNKVSRAPFMADRIIGCRRLT